MTRVIKHRQQMMILLYSVLLLLSQKKESLTHAKIILSLYIYINACSYSRPSMYSDHATSRACYNARIIAYTVQCIRYVASCSSSVRCDGHPEGYISYTVMTVNYYSGRYLVYIFSNK